MGRLGTLVQIFILLEHPDWSWSQGCGSFGSISHTKCACASEASGFESSVSRKHPASWTCAWQSSAHCKPWNCCMWASPVIKPGSDVWCPPSCPGIPPVIKSWTDVWHPLICPGSACSPTNVTKLLWWVTAKCPEVNSSHAGCSVFPSDWKTHKSKSALMG